MDSIQMIKWVKTPPGSKGTMFATASWDGVIRIFKVNPQTQNSIASILLIKDFKFDQPVLSLEWLQQQKYENPNYLFGGLMDGSIKSINLNSFNVQDFFRIEEPVLNIFYCNLLFMCI